MFGVVREWIREKMLLYPEVYVSILEKHFVRHLEPFAAASNYENGGSE
jgi:hypothetical protein